PFGSEFSFGTSNDDIITGRNLAGLSGNDTLVGISGDYNNLKGLAGDDTLYGQDLDDRLDGGAGNDVIYAGDGMDTVYGGSGNDILYGGGAVDFLYGGEGNDWLDGGEGGDILTGGLGADIFVFKNATAFGYEDVIQDFSISEGDKIDISDVLSAFDPLSDVIANFGELTWDGLKIDQSGSGSNFVKIANVYSQETLDDISTLYQNGSIIV
ncbi:MAG: hypothetical protein DI626_12045, partial [Micavibrio aeruginosavorus]